MGNLAITPANVGLIGDASTFKRMKVGSAAVQGEVRYKLNDALMLADATTAAKAKVDSIVLTPASLDGYALVGKKGLINIGATMTVGKAYFLSATAGMICLESDLVSGNIVIFLGIAVAATVLDFQPVISEVAVP